jgi:hypothetical protein
MPEHAAVSASSTSRGYGGTFDGTVTLRLSEGDASSPMPYHERPDRYFHHRWRPLFFPILWLISRLHLRKQNIAQHAMNSGMSIAGDNVQPGLHQVNRQKQHLGTIRSQRNEDNHHLSHLRQGMYVPGSMSIGQETLHTMLIVFVRTSLVMGNSASKGCGRLMQPSRIQIATKTLSCMQERLWQKQKKQTSRQSPPPPTHADQKTTEQSLWHRCQIGQTKQRMGTH